MPTSVTMPALGESVTEGTVTRWLKKEGERVETDEPLLEVSTDKVDTEIPSPAAGVLSHIKVGEDETVEVGVELALIDAGGEAASDNGSAPAESAQQSSAPAEAPPETPAEAPAAPQQEDAERGRQEQPAAEAPAAEPAPERPAAREEQPAPDRPIERAEAPAPQQSQQSSQSQPQPSPPSQPRGEGEQGGADAAERAYVTPLVRKLAAEQNVDLSTVTGTGVGGRIRKQDVVDAAASSQASRPEPAAAAEPAAASAGATAGASTGRAVPSESALALRGTTQKMSRPRSVIASRMVESLQTSAQLTTVVEADVTAIARLRQRAKADFEARQGVRLSFLPFFALAAVEALKAHPNLNASIDTDAGTITYHDAEHLGIAVDTERGLMVPVIHSAGDLNLGGLARKIADLAARTRQNKVSPDELGGGTFTLTNTGSRGALFDTPIINQPQVAILGTGSVVKRPVVIDDPDLGEVITVRSMVYLALTYDHRLVDGADAARFLVAVKERLEAGSFEAEVGLA
jgi:2-oxoglutarate dehydrogenase E2 component (dihydrolipoamide succinyltransferase)